ncbi:hypothetical protein Spob023 [Spilosoma obliqua nucleopolyhedrosis virus]|uniref:ORF24 peptide n=1 Tax=Hyphantria cunea nuclear polyhedrosis virus TaxID=28288 RepID=Q2NNW5_NPVHC|nr:ORF24 peptide [Hyphantria cunea nucleopolyhedrovirus]AUR45054.1 hypothetical protein Spob023 [Spilosoma obliqua nucleopolyhedrosis virus]BAE72313.1 ORF24 peptide [Hyphantria cunea nucleopolyhedrovirus]
MPKTTKPYSRPSDASSAGVTETTKPYSRPSDAPSAGVTEIKIERSNQFKAASGKFGKRHVDKFNKETRLTGFIDIKLVDYQRSLKLNDKLESMLKRQKSIFSDKIAFEQKQTFVVAFAHPTYSIKYKKSPTNELKIYCDNINKDLLFKNKNRQLSNALPNVASFRVHINDQTIFNVQTAIYDREDAQLILSLYLSPQQLIELLPLKKCVIFLNILPFKNWTVPLDLMHAFMNLPLPPPLPAA